MDIKLSSDNINDYLKVSSVIDFDNITVAKLAQQLKADNPNDEIALIKATFDHVRDTVDHSMDIGGDVATLKASEVIEHNEGFCYAKSHLLAALLRYNKIPVGFCYQRLIFHSIKAPYLVLHGLNGVYISSIDKWIRLDARGNKNGVNAQFNLDKEQLAYAINKEDGEEDILMIFDEPDKNVIEKLSLYNTVEELSKDLPKSISK